MSNNQHPHADILRAIADGKEIQYKIPNGTIDWQTANTYSILEKLRVNEVNMEGQVCYEFRIKPETKTGWIGIYSSYGVQSISNPVTDMYDSKDALLNVMSDKPIAIIQITYAPGEGL